VSSAPHPALSSSAARALAYHRRTKHHPHRYAASTGWLDWDNQPDPFRTYEGAPRLALGLAADGVATRYADLYAATDGQEAVAPRALDATSLAAFFELALGLTAWKSFGESRWALRADPSSGNLHPTEGYAVLPSSRASRPACGTTSAATTRSSCARRSRATLQPSSRARCRRAASWSA
jgi:hypothetical protein